MTWLIFASCASAAPTSRALRWPWMADHQDDIASMSTRPSWSMTRGPDALSTGYVNYPGSAYGCQM